MRSSKREAINKKLALLSGWKRTANRNWQSPNGLCFALPPDYCRVAGELSTLTLSLDDDEREATVKFLVTMKEKRKGDA